MLLDSLSRLEQDDNLHLGRLLLILKALSAHDPEHAVEGLTKLVKLDFLLRYPTFLERALEARQANAQSVATEEHERRSVESAMVRYRFGPWDERYRRFLNLLSSRDLIRVTVEGRKVVIMLTDKGVETAGRLALDEAFQKINRRAQLLRNFDLTATTLMKFIYSTFPEIGSLRLGRTIR